jgi:signal transduction histidine kinase
VTENNLLRIGQEAIVNAVRHARCGRIEVTLAFGERQVALSVHDDGQGFDPEHPPRSEGGFGLAGMRERAEQMHGEFHVISALGKGTMVRVTVP